MLPLTETQAHYLFVVMRVAVGMRILVFNGQDGEWLAEVEVAGKRGGNLRCVEQVRVQDMVADLWLLFAPVKKARTDFIVEKAVELGMARILPVQTDFTNAERMRADKAAAHVREAAEQCGGTHLPDVAALQPLAKLLSGWDPARRILWADESGAGQGSGTLGILTCLEPGPWALLVGPEGGFSAGERARLQAMSFVVPIALGPRILRAETAALAMMTLWQVHLGDWP